jgi:CheY-like chemotaxis protein
MLIENDVITREIYNALLVQQGYEVLIATDLRTAWDKLQEEAPDAALFDLVLPDTHGFDLLRSIRGNMQLKDLPVVVYTSMFIPGVVEEAREAGATRVFDKAHLSGSTLIDTLKECLVVGQPVA